MGKAGEGKGGAGKGGKGKEGTRRKGKGGEGRGGEYRRFFLYTLRTDFGGTRRHWRRGELGVGRGCG